jgi:hypothetical protein
MTVAAVAGHGTVARYMGHGCRCNDCREAVRQRSISRREASEANDGVYPGQIAHGGSAYANYGCRCDACTAAHTRTVGMGRRKRYELTQRNGGVAPTGVHNESTYQNWGCRCVTCKAAQAAAYADLKRRDVS